MTLTHETATKEKHMSTIQLQPVYGPDTLACPTCGSQALVEWRTDLESTGGPVEHLTIRCPGGHRFFMPAPAVAVPAYEGQRGFLS